METQAYDAPGARRIPKIQPPACLGEVVAILEAHDAYPFDHTLQYKKPFRKLHAALKQGTSLPNLPFVTNAQKLKQRVAVDRRT